MTITLPALCPSSRELVLATYSTSAGEWQDGAAAYPKCWSDIPVDAILRVSYQNITDTLASQFIDCWNLSLRGILPITIPVETVDGMTDTELRNRILQPDGLSWKFASAPTVANVISGISTVQLELEATAEPKHNTRRMSNIFIDVAPATYNIYLYDSPVSISQCQAWPSGGGSSNNGGVSTFSVNNTLGTYIEMEIYVPPIAARTCSMFYEIPPADIYTPKVYGTKSDGTRTLLFSTGPAFAGWYMDSISRTYCNSVVGGRSIGIKNITTGQKFGPWFNNGINIPYYTGIPLGISGVGGDSTGTLVPVPANWFDNY
jgi:hypothetical protein